MNKIKYIRTNQNEIIIFGEIMNHSDFKNMNPVSAGFINIYADQEGEMKCSCYGESISLGIKSNPEEDSKLAKLQLFGWF